MAARPLPDQATLLKLLRYEPETGKLFWRERPHEMFKRAAIAKSWNAKWAGREAGSSSPATRYSYVAINLVEYLAHRLIWKMVMGRDPEVIDHINGKGRDNRWFNIREVTFAENMLNQSGRDGTTSRQIGVCWSQEREVWRAYITKNGHTRWLGAFANESEAVLARKRAERGWGFHPNHGRLR
jgi:hypothetical protein